MQSILGDYIGFFQGLNTSLLENGIDIGECRLSHLAFRTATLEEYLAVRQRIEAHSLANVENQWNGRPISKLLLREPLRVSPVHEVDLIELIPPVHQREYPMGLEHLGVVIGEGFEQFCAQRAEVLTGQQDQGPFCQPRYITFANNTTVKFYRYSLQDVVEKEGRRFDGFHHA